MAITFPAKDPAFRFQVPSKSIPGEYHIVEVWDDGRITCDCLWGGIFGKGRKDCRHIAAVKKYLKEHIRAEKKVE